MNLVKSVDFGGSYGTTGAKAVAVGVNHACAILKDDQAKCWGYNGSGQLGQGNLVNYGNNISDRVDVEGTIAFTGGNGGSGPQRTVKRISVGQNHTCAVLSDATGVCWGDGSRGQIGQGSIDNSGANVGPFPNLKVTPDLKFYDPAQGLVDISAGYQHSCALLSAGKVVCWGANDFGQLGLETAVTGAAAGVAPFKALSSVPPVPLPQPAIAAYAGWGFSCAILSDRSVKCWGRGAEGQLGQDSTQGFGLAPGDLAAVKPLQFFPDPPPGPPPGP
jgi:alpha-tubulin suppressor-like RCC1 family protein